MGTVNVEGMEAYTPPEIKGTCTLQVKDARLSTSEKGFTLFLEIVEGPEEQDWQDEQIMCYVHTDFAGTNKAGDPYPSFMIKRWKKGLHDVCTAFGVNLKQGSFDTDDFVGKEAIAEVGPDKNGEHSIRRWIVG